MDEYLNKPLEALVLFYKFLLAPAVTYGYVAAGVVIVFVVAFWFFRDKGK